MVAAAEAAEAEAAAPENALVGNKREVITFLQWAGFSTAFQRERIWADAFMIYEDIMMMKESDVTELAGSFQKRSAKIILGQRRVKKLKALLHWVKEFRRTSMEPSLGGLDQATFSEALATAERRQEISKVQIESSENVMKEASPGPLKSEANWQDCMPLFTNFLSSIFGVGGVLQINARTVIKTGLELKQDSNHKKP